MRIPAVTPEDVRPYLKTGPGELDGALVSRVGRLLACAPIRPQCVWNRVDPPSPWSDGVAYLVCGTIGAEFDTWHRRLSVTSASDAFLAQAIGAAAVEAVMDAAEREILATLPEGTALKPRWSPGYGARPLAMSAEILDRLDATRRIGVALTESLLLVPSKSVTAVVEVIGHG